VHLAEPGKVNHDGLTLTRYQPLSFLSDPDGIVRRDIAADTQPVAGKVKSG
jgi:hypothetical protein